MAEFTIMDAISNLLNGLLWFTVFVISLLRLSKNHLVTTEKVIYALAGLTGSVKAVLVLVPVFAHVTAVEQLHRLQIVQPFIGASLVLFMLFYRNKTVE